MLIKDIAFFPNSSINTADEDDRSSYSPIKNRFLIADDIYIEKLPKELWQEVFRICTLIGREDAVPQFSQLYAFVREFRGEIVHHLSIRWDHDERLQLCMGLSRIIHPTTISSGYSARIIEGDGIRRIIPGPANDFGAAAWLSGVKSRNWLTVSDAEELKGLVSAFFLNASQLPKRIKQAIWYTEYAFRTFHLDIRWPLACMGLESLIHTDRIQSTKQFSSRVSKIAQELGMLDFTEQEVTEAYETRSALAHGQLLRDLDPYKIDIYDKLEIVLRLVIKKAILEPTYANIFSSEERIRIAYPI